MADPLVVGSLRGGVVERVGDADRITYTCNTGAVTGGQLVEHVTGDRQCQPAGANSNKVAGLAIHSAAVGEIVTVAAEGVWDIIASGSIAAGDRLVTDSAGRVKTAGATPDARQLVGIAQNDAIDGALCQTRLGGSIG